MSIELHIQTIKGRMEDGEEPSTAWKLDMGVFEQREINQFYYILKHVVRHIERIIDEDMEEEDGED